MDSPHVQSPSQHQRVRTNNNLPVQSVSHSGGIRKRNFERARSISTTQADRLHQLALTQAEVNLAASGIQWITPQHSPQTRAIFPEPSIEPLPTWTVPTPPRSDSGFPILSIDNPEDPATGGINTSQEFQLEQPAEMSSLGFLLPSQYGSTLYESGPSSYTMEQHYIPPIKVSQSTATTGCSAYAQTTSSSPSLYQNRTAPDSCASNRRHSEVLSSTTNRSYEQSYRRVSNPYTTSSGTYSSAPGQTIPSISGLTQNPLPSPHMLASTGSSDMPRYHTSLSRSPALSYDSGMYQQPYSRSPASTQPSAHPDSMSYSPPFIACSVAQVSTKPLGSDSSIRVLNHRPKPQCWEHGCNGRQFSTFSNLLRHQREKSGTATKSYCPKCGAEFTRTTARNGHLAHDKCGKQRRGSEDK